LEKGLRINISHLNRNIKKELKERIDEVSHVINAILKTTLKIV